ncbi:hypothetical protein NPIL_579551 [Nephila pilipes]|uniref:Uncharacterized protein n=1 Tax=Nephila pilipes TaxID=299642 RepID=A0A8X6I700_NEPPI|nr:hypothetical protein NPIL_579551 [Nephila pilipes]
MNKSANSSEEVSEFSCIDHCELELEEAYHGVDSFKVLNMSWKKVFKTAEEVIEYLFSEELESEMIVLPPEVDEFTDEEGFYDSETLDPSVRDVICPIICKLT